MHWISLGILIGLALLINVDIFARNILSRPLSGVPEIMGQAIVIFAFCQMPNSFLHGKVLRNETFLNGIAMRSPRLKRGLSALFHILAFAILIPLVVHSFPMLIKDWISQDFVGAVGNFTWPIWPTRCAIILGSLVLMAQILRCGWRDLR